MMTLFVNFWMFLCLAVFATTSDRPRDPCESIFLSETQVSREMFGKWLQLGDMILAQINQNKIGWQKTYAFHFTFIHELKQLLQKGYLPVEFKDVWAAHAIPFNPPDDEALGGVARAFLAARVYSQMFARIKRFLDGMNVTDTEERRKLIRSWTTRLMSQRFPVGNSPENEIVFNVDYIPDYQQPEEYRNKIQRATADAVAYAIPAQGYIVVLNQEARFRIRLPFTNLVGVLIMYDAKGVPLREVAAIMPLGEVERQEVEILLNGSPPAASVEATE
jgi:hypothetical protein